MSGGLPHPEDKTDDRLEIAELRLQVMPKTVLYCRLNNYLFIFFLLYCHAIITKNNFWKREKKISGEET